jgi:hypothetical protein
MSIVRTSRPAAASEKPMSDLTVTPAPPLQIIDFHSHYVGPSFTLTTLAGVPPALRAFWEGVNRLLVDPGALIA